jgi:hypothetical protein
MHNGAVLVVSKLCDICYLSGTLVESVELKKYSVGSQVISSQSVCHETVTTLGVFREVDR